MVGSPADHPAPPRRPRRHRLPGPAGQRDRPDPDPTPEAAPGGRRSSTRSPRPPRCARGEVLRVEPRVPVYDDAHARRRAAARRRPRRTTRRPARSPCFAVNRSTDEPSSSGLDLRGSRRGLPGRRGHRSLVRRRRPRHEHRADSPTGSSPGPPDIDRWTAVAARPAPAGLLDRHPAPATVSDRSPNRPRSATHAPATPSASPTRRRPAQPARLPRRLGAAPLLLLAGCGSGPGLGAPAAVRRRVHREVRPARRWTLDYWNGFTGGDGPTMQALVKSSTAATRTSPSRTTRSSGPTSTSGSPPPPRPAAGPDVGVMHLDQLATNAARSVIVPLDDVAEAARPVARATSPRPCGSPGIYNGKRYGIPLDVHSLAMYYNKDHFEKAGIAERADGRRHAGRGVPEAEGRRASSSRSGCRTSGRRT